jgi:ribosomal protein S18 acetylase RimI-like enzyme
MILLEKGSNDMFEDLADLYNAVTSQDDTDHRDIDGDYLRLLFSRHGSKAEENAILARDSEGRLIGSSVFFPDRRRTGELLMRLHVHPDFRQQGIGIALLEESMDQQKDFDAFVCIVPSFREYAINAAKNWGCVKVGGLKRMVLRSLRNFTHPTAIPEYEIRKAEGVDSSQWADLQNRLFEGHFRYVPVTSDFYEELRERDDFVGELSLVGTHNGEIVSYCHGRLLDKGEASEEKNLLIQGFGVASQDRGRGFGTHILKAVLARAADMGITRSSLLVHSEAEPAISLYHKLGYREVYTLLYFRKAIEK